VKKILVIQSFGASCCSVLASRPARGPDHQRFAAARRAEAPPTSPRRAGMEVIASTRNTGPGDAVELHFHHGVEAAYVVQGARVQAPGQEARTIATGATTMNLRDVKHGGFKVVATRR